MGILVSRSIPLAKISAWLYPRFNFLLQWLGIGIIISAFGIVLICIYFMPKRLPSLNPRVKTPLYFNL